MADTIVARQPPDRLFMLDRPEKTLLRALILCVGTAVFGSCNPFAPTLDEVKVNHEELLGNRRTIEGFFEWFRNSYELRDSTMYGKLLAPEFQFTYPDFQNSTEVSWDRNVEMQTTNNLFRGVKSINLQWNNFIELDTITFDSLARAERSFNLIITHDDNNIYRGVGSALLILRRDMPNGYWRMQSWYDKSDF